MQAVFKLLHAQDSVIDKLQALADEALLTAQKPYSDPGLQALPLWYKASVLFEFSLGFLCISYPQLREARAFILETFKESVKLL